MWKFKCIYIFFIGVGFITKVQQLSQAAIVLLKQLLLFWGIVYCLFLLFPYESHHSCETLQELAQVPFIIRILDDNQWQIQTSS